MTRRPDGEHDDTSGLPAARAAVRIFAAVVVLAVVAAPGNLRAQQATDADRNPLTPLLRGSGLATDPGQPADWVRAARPPQEELYGRRHVPDQQPQRPLMDRDAVRALEQELNRLRAGHDRAAQRPAAAAAGSAAGPPPAPAPAPAPGCVLTCNTGLGTPARK